MKFFPISARLESGLGASPNESVTFEVRTFAMEPWTLGGVQDAHRTYLTVLAKLWNEFSLHSNSRPQLRATEDAVEMVGPQSAFPGDEAELQMLSDKLFRELVVNGVEALYDVDRLVRRLHMPRTGCLANAS